MHLDLDAFFASVEQRDKPSLRGKPVIVGGVGGRGVVATASYEARAFGVRSAMSTREARSLCPHAAFLTGRFHAYRESSGAVMELLRSVSPLVEPLSLDEAFIDLRASSLTETELADPAVVAAFAEEIRARVGEVTGGLTASVGVASSKFVAKVASDLDKPDGLVMVPPGTERTLLDPLSVKVIPGVGPATAERLRRAGIRTIAELAGVSLEELIRLVGKAHGASLHLLARAEDNRDVEPERETKSVSVEGTYEEDLTDRRLMDGLLRRMAGNVAGRLRTAGLSGRTVTIKVRLHDFTTLSRSSTLSSPTEDSGVIGRVASGLLADIDTSGGVRLLGVGVSGLADWVQEELFTDRADEDDHTEVPADQSDPADPAHPADPADGAPLTTPAKTGTEAASEAGAAPLRAFSPGSDVTHSEYGDGWVWGSGRGVVTVRFETAGTPPGPVRSLRIDDPALQQVSRGRYET